MSDLIYVLRYEDLEEKEHVHIYRTALECIEKAIALSSSNPFFNYFECIELIRYSFHDCIEIDDVLECNVIELQNKDIIWDIKNRDKMVGIIKAVKHRALETAILWGLSIREVTKLCMWYERMNGADNDDKEYVFCLADSDPKSDNIDVIASSKNFDDLIETMFSYDLPEGHELGLVINENVNGEYEVEMHVIRNSNSFVSVDTLKLIKETMDEIYDREDLSEICRYSVIKVLNDIIVNIGGIEHE